MNSTDDEIVWFHPSPHIYYYEIPGGNTVANLRNYLIVNNRGASFKIVDLDTTITNASEFASAQEKLGSTLLGSYDVKVVVKATDGTTINLYPVVVY